MKATWLISDSSGWDVQKVNAEKVGDFYLVIKEEPVKMNNAVSTVMAPFGF